MKRYVKLLSLPLLTLMLVACDNQNKPAEETTTVAEVTTVAQTTSSQVSTPNDTTVADQSKDEKESTAEGETTVEGAESEEGQESKDEANENEESEVAATDVKFTLYVDGAESGTYVAKDAVGGSVLDAMESIEDLEFNFDEAEGFIDSIAGYDNDYAAEKTWIYLLNGEYAEYGVVSQTLSEGDEVEWYFGHPDDLPVNIIPE